MIGRLPGHVIDHGFLDLQAIRPGLHLARAGLNRLLKQGLVPLTDPPRIVVGAAPNITPSRCCKCTKACSVVVIPPLSTITRLGKSRLSR